MSSLLPTTGPRRFRAPSAEHPLLCIPPPAELANLVAENVAQKSTFQVDIQGRTFSDLSTAARQQLLQAAHRYSSNYRDVPPIIHSQSIYLAGHQAELYHPGVWAKNFLLDQLARSQQAVGVNLVVDSDLFKQSAIATLGGSTKQPAKKRVMLDDPGPLLPAEEYSVRNESLWQSFSQRVQSELNPWVAEPLLKRYWSLAEARRKAGTSPALALAQARHQVEGDWGLQTLEVPLSHTCRFESFFWWCCHLLAHLPRFQQVHNAVLQDYRTAHRLRSHSHPVPELAAEDGWWEAPFWVWSSHSPHREHLWVQPHARHMLLSDRRDFRLELPLSADQSAAAAVSVLLDAADKGMKLRTRALTTTMWARMCLGDVFVHGIGGAKYDELTDGLLAGFWHINPPAYITLSATVRLPVPRPPVSREDGAKLKQQLRELQYHPDRWLDLASLSADETAQAQHALDLKSNWLTQPITPQNVTPRHQALVQANAMLQPFVERQRVLLQAERKEWERSIRLAEVLNSREYAFVLYPESFLRDFLLAIVPTSF